MKEKTKNKKEKWYQKRHFKVLVFLVFVVFILFSHTNNSYALGNGQTVGEFANSLVGIAQDPVGSLVSPLKEGLLWVFKQLLYGIFVIVSWLLGVAAIMFSWVIDTKNVKFVLDNDAITISWGTVRDFLNLAFILVLLYSAFCTIFQVEKYHLKKILLMLVIMALLVNFSLPISRFIIDVSNVMFYYLINNIFPDTAGDGIFAHFADRSNIVQILTPDNIGNAEISYLVAIIVFTFILMMTLLVIACLFVVRLIVLAILIIFSPVGFVAAIFPSTKHYADDWWSNLFKYAFFAPIMAFMMSIAINILEIMKKNNVDKSFLQVANNNLIYKEASSVDVNVIGSMAFFAIPIVILWTGMIVAQKLSIAGANTVVGRASKFAGWAGKKFTGAAAIGRVYKSYQSRRQEAQQAGVANRLGKWIGSQQDRARSVVADRGGRDARNRYEADRLKRVDDAYKSRNMGDMDPTDLINMRDTGNADERAAAIKALAEQGRATVTDLNTVRNDFGETSQVFRQLNNKVRTYDPVAAFTDAAGVTNWARATEFTRSNQFDLKKVTSNNSLGNAQFWGMLFDNNLVDAKKVEDVRNANNAGAITTSLQTLAASRTAVNPENRSIHMAAFSQAGRFTNTANAAANNTFIEHIVRNMNKENSKRTHISFVQDPRVQTYMSDNLRPNQTKQIILNMDDRYAQSEMVNFLRDPARNFGSVGNPNADILRGIASRDPDLRRM